MKKYVKILSIMLLAIMLISTISTTCFATGADGVITTVEGQIGDNYRDIKGYDKINSTAGTIIKIIRYAAIVIAVVLIAVFGIKFMLGSAEEKAEYKKSFIPLIIGVVVVFAATYIAQLIFSIAS